MRREFVKGIALVLAAGLMVTAFAGTGSEAAAKAKLKTKKMVLAKGQKKKILITGKKKKAVYTYAVKKKSIVSVSKQGVVKARKKGKTSVVVKEKIKNGKKTATRTLGKVQVQVKAAAPKQTPVPTDRTSNTPAPTDSNPDGTAQPSETVLNPTVEPEKTEKPVMSATPKPTDTPYSTVAPGQTLKPATDSSTPKTWIDENVQTPAKFDVKQDGVAYYEKKTISYYSSLAEKNRSAIVLLPPNYSEDKEYPVLYMLHGIGGSESEWMQGHPDWILGNMNAAGTAKEMIMVLPNQLVQLPGETMPDFYLDPGRFVMFDRIVEELKTSLIPFIETNFSTKGGRDNRAVCGLSMGGREAIHTGVDLIEDFAYMGAFEPAIGVLPYDIESGIFTEETLTIPEQYRPISMFMIVKGNQDGTVGEWPRIYSETLKNNGVEHFYYTMDGGHDFKVWKNGLYNFARRIFQ